MEIWLANKSEIKNEEEIAVIHSGLSIADVHYSSQYVFLDDKIRSTLSILLQRALIRATFTVDESAYRICRTRENKPFVRLNNGSSGNWNYNLSHHGSYVAIASSSTELVGVDIVDTLTRAPSMASCATDFISIYRKQLAIRELSELMSIECEESKYIHFFILWALKESYIKAIGSGFGFDPSNVNRLLMPLLLVMSAQVDFLVSYNKSSVVNKDVTNVKGKAVATILGVPRRDWFFDFWALDDHHLIAVARGPLSDAIPSYKATAGLSSSDQPLQPNCSFQVVCKTVASLMH